MYKKTKGAKQSTALGLQLSDLMGLGPGFQAHLGDQTCSLLKTVVWIRGQLEPMQKVQVRKAPLPDLTVLFPFPTGEKGSPPRSDSPPSLS